MKLMNIYYNTLIVVGVLFALICFFALKIESYNWWFGDKITYHWYWIEAKHTYVSVCATIELWIGYIIGAGILLIALFGGYSEFKKLLHKIKR